GHARRIVDNGAGAWAHPAAAAGQPSPNNWAELMPWSAALRQGPDGALWFVERPFWAQPEARLARIRPANLPSRNVTVVAGSGQVTNATTDFAAPLIVEVVDAAGQPVADASVGFEVLGAAELIGDSVAKTGADGRASVALRALDESGQAALLTYSPGANSPAIAQLFSRQLTVSTTPTQMEVRIDNATAAVPANVYYFVTMSIGTTTPLVTPFGTLRCNPFAPGSLVIEDATGLFNNVSFSGLGAVGDPSLVRSYPLPPGLITGFSTKLEAVGFDPLSGWFVTNLANASF
ncbi:MAG: hypothetical protein VYD05_07535, partial [Planctomycetota bacterium]|nr:hypothetical protein [Planctomycetota bacterium]